MVNGLAWTEVGGELLTIETDIVNGTGKIQLTGQLGDVMKESAMTAISFVRSKAEKFNIDENFLRKKIFISMFQKELFLKMVLQQE